jgi:hypothetical protein
MVPHVAWLEKVQQPVWPCQGQNQLPHQAPHQQAEMLELNLINLPEPTTLQPLMPRLVVQKH